MRVVEKSAPLAWNDFEMGVGCGGGVGTAAFGTDLDAGRPTLTPKAGQRDFPYKVSESDPEVFYVFADARAHNVSWYLELDWSGGDRHGTVRVDDRGRPFRTSGNVGRPAYSHPLGSSEWGPPSRGDGRPVPGRGTAPSGYPHSFPVRTNPPPPRDRITSGDVATAEAPCERSRVHRRESLVPT